MSKALPVVTVTVTYPNVGPEQMEALVTRPIENAVSRVNGIQLINSDSQLGQSTVSAQFYYGTNLDTAAVDVQQQVEVKEDHSPRRRSASARNAASPEFRSRKRL